MKKKIIVIGAAGNLGMYFIDYLMSHLDLTKFEIVATGTKKEYPYDFYKGTYYQLNIINKSDFNKLPTDNVHAVVDFAGVLPAYSSSITAVSYTHLTLPTIHSV